MNGKIRVVYVVTDRTASDATASALESECPELDVRIVPATEALDALERERVDCVVFEVDGDDREAIGLVETIAGRHPEPLRVLFADGADPDLVRDAFVAGVDDYVPEAGPESLVALAHQIKAGAGTERRFDEGDRTKEQLRALTRSASDAIVTITGDSRIEFANPAIEEILGYDPDELLGESLTELMSEEMAERHRRAVERYLADGKRRLDWHAIELPGVHADGYEVPLSISFGEFVVDGERFFTGIIRDVTERKRRETERELRSATTELIAEADTLESGLRAAIREIGETLGWAYGEAWLPTDRDDALRRVSTWGAPSVDADSLESIAAGATVEPGAGLAGRAWDDGSPIWLTDLATEAGDHRANVAAESGLRAALGVPVRAADGIVAVLTFFRADVPADDERLVETTTSAARNLGDQIGRELAKAELRRERELNDRILETSPVGISLLDTDGGVEFMNAYAERILGMKSGDRSDRRYEEFASRIYDRSGDPMPDENEPYKRVLNGEDEVSTVLQFERFDGDRVWLDVNSVSVRNDDGEVTGVIFAFEDITQERRMQTELTESWERVTDAFFSVDAEWRFTYLNDTAEELLYRSDYELVGSVLWEEFPEAVGTTFEEKYRTAMAEQEPVQFEEYYAPLETWFSVRAYPSETGLSVYFRDVTERKRYEQTLTALHWSSRQLLEATSPAEVAEIALDAAVDTLDFPGTGIYLYDPEEQALVPSRVSEHARELFGGLPTFGPDDDSIIQRAYETGATVTHEDVDEAESAYRYDTALESGIWIPLGDHGVIAVVSDEVEAFDGRDRQLAELLAATVETALDRVARESTLERREEQLTHLNETSQELATAESVTEVSEMAVAAARQALGLPLAAIELYDEETGKLRPAARTPELAELVDDGPLFGGGEDPPWKAFLANDRAVYPDVGAAEGVSVEETPFGSAVVLPLERYGVFVGGSRSATTFTDSELSFVEILVRNTISALDRVNREESLRDRTETLEAQNETLERLRHVNEVIREISQVLIQASSRQEIEQAVCDRLASADPYRFVWIGSRDPVTDEVEPNASAGVERGYLEEVTITADESATGAGPIGETVRTHESRVLDNVNFDRSFEQWREQALDRGYQSLITVPLVYGDTLYGVLTIYGDKPGLFSEMERSVLTELGEMIGYSLNALERKQALVSESSVELELQIEDPNRPWLAFDDRDGYEFELEDIVQRRDGTLHVFYAIRGDSSDEGLSIGEETPGINDVALIAERDGEWLFTGVLSETSFLARLIDRGAMPESITASGSRTRIVIRIPQSAEIRTFVELFESEYDNVNLVARREVSEPVKTLQEYRTDLTERLTDRQREILRTAYSSGFFEWPREATAQDIADMFGVSQPTISRHLRRGEERLFSLLFGDDEDDLDT